MRHACEEVGTFAGSVNQGAQAKTLAPKPRLRHKFPNTNAADLLLCAMAAGEAGAHLLDVARTVDSNTG